MPSPLPRLGRPWPRPVRYLLALLGGAGLVALALGLGWIDFSSAARTARQMAGLDPWFAAGVVLLFTCAGALRGLVFWLVLRSSGSGIRLRRVLLAQGVGSTAGAGLPGPVTDSLRVFLIRDEHTPIPQIVGALGLQKVLEALCGFFFIGALAPMLPLPSGLAHLSWFPVVLLGAGVLAALVARRGWSPAPRSGRIALRLRRVATELMTGAHALRSARTVVGLCLIELMAIFLNVLGLWLLLNAFWSTGPALALCVFLLVKVSSLVPTIGGLGTREAALIPVISSVLAAGLSDALAFSLSIHVAGLMSGVVLVLALTPLLAGSAARASLRTRI